MDIWFKILFIFGVGFLIFSWVRLFVFLGKIFFIKFDNFVLVMCMIWLFLGGCGSKWGGLFLIVFFRRGFWYKEWEEWWVEFFLDERMLVLFICRIVVFWIIGLWLFLLFLEDCCCCKFFIECIFVEFVFWFWFIWYFWLIFGSIYECIGEFEFCLKFVGKRLKGMMFILCWYLLIWGRLW